jgi:hypothetical protein
MTAHKTTTKHETTTASAEGETQLQSAPPPPTAKAPIPPANVDLTQKVGRGLGVGATLATLAASAATEISSSTTFTADFGEKGDPSVFAQTLAYAAAWREEWERAQNWLKYVRIGNAAAAVAAKKQLGRYHSAYDHASGWDPTVPKRYPQLAALYQAQSAVGVRAANTRANNKKAKGAAATEAESDATTAPAAAPPRLAGTT